MIMKSMTANLRLAAIEAIKVCYDRTMKTWVFNQQTQIFRYRNNYFAVLPVRGKDFWKWQVFQKVNATQWNAIGAPFTYRPVFTYKNDAPQLHVEDYVDDMVWTDTSYILW